MKIELLSFRKVSNISSGSGLAHINGYYYVVGDDAYFLFKLDKQFNIVKKIPLVSSMLDTSLRIPKSIKPDFEAMEVISENQIVIFGSGSKSPKRDSITRVFLDSNIVETYNGSAFYNYLKIHPTFVDSELNIEGCAYTNGILYLLNRKKNILISVEYNELINYLKNGKDIPQVTFEVINLPRINNIEAGFSGATVSKHHDNLVFVASVENTPNAYDDGEILGSFIGSISTNVSKTKTKITSCEVPKNYGNLKIESVTIVNENPNGTLNVLLVTDQDDGTSNFIEANVYID